VKNKELWLIASVAFIAGLLVGLVVADSRNSQPVKVSAPSQVAPVAPNNNVQLLERIVQEQPQNFNAWVQLAHSLFDANQPMEAVKAYGRALELQPDNADLLTDQGVMFRRLGWFDQAVKNFERAAQVDPQHIQSLYNLGIVYRYDLADLPKAISAWERYLKRNPTGPSSDQVRQQLDQMRSGFDTRLPH